MKRLNSNKASWHVLAIILLALSTVTASAQKADFSGTWKRNDTKTTTSGGLSINSIPVTVAVKQESNSVTILRTSRNAKGEITSYSETLSFEGKPAETITPSKLRKSATLQWSADDQQFTEDASSKDDSGVVKQKSKQVWSLQQTGKILQILALWEVNGQRAEMTEVYDRQ